MEKKKRKKKGVYGDGQWQASSLSAALYVICNTRRLAPRAAFVAFVARMMNRRGHCTGCAGLVLAGCRWVEKTVLYTQHAPAWNMWFK